MPRQSVADLLADVADEPPVEPPPLPAHPPVPVQGPGPAVPPAESSRQRSPARPRRPRTAATGTTGLTESQTPKWQRLERKELRLRADQLDDLARLRRGLNRQRGGEGERITENTLIRVAVDLLLARAGNLHGLTEDELRKSVTS
jgi:hypothetical protein